MNYVDGYVAVVPNENKDEYIRNAAVSAELFKEHGAVRVVECWGDEVPDGEKTSFLKAVACGPDETVVFSWVEWPSADARNTSMKALEKDPRLAEIPMLFDGSRLIYGSFQMVVEE